MSVIVTRDGKPVSPVLADENAGFAWLLRHQSMSTDWAIKHEGYAVVAAQDAGLTLTCFTCGFVTMTGTMDSRDAAHLAHDGAHESFWYTDDIVLIRDDADLLAALATAGA